MRASITASIGVGLIAAALLAGAGVLALESAAEASQQVTKYVRYSHEGTTSYGILEGDTVYELDGDLFASPQRSGSSMPLADVTLLAPVEPSKVIAVGLNYRSHIGRSPVPEYPGLFAKYPTSIVGPDAEIFIPADAGNVHYEGARLALASRGDGVAQDADAGRRVSQARRRRGSVPVGYVGDGSAGVLSASRLRAELHLCCYRSSHGDTLNARLTDKTPPSRRNSVGPSRVG